MLQKRDPDAGAGGAVRESSGDDGAGPATVRAPSVSLPRGGGAIKGIDEKFHVNAVNGTAGLSIALPFSPARDASPSLHLRYDSGAGNGVFGLGWALDLPSIKRKTDAELPQYTDADTFMLSDADDLVPALEKHANGDWRPRCFDSPCGAFRIRPYRPRIEQAFSRIECWTHQATGDVRWRVITKDNRTTLFGWSAASRVADPADARRIVQWLPEFSFDDRGNCARYLYGGEDAADIETALLHNRNRCRDGAVRCTNRCLERVLYGNKTPYRGFSHAVPPEGDFLFSTVFDHGEHEAAAPCARTGRRRPRHDAFSDYKPGFEVRTTRLCQRVLLYHHAEALPGGSALVKSLDFQHSDAAETGFSYLESITERGYAKGPDGRYTERAMPPLEFQYRHEEWSPAVKAISQVELAHRPAGPNAQRQQFVDLYNEGLSGLLTESGEGWTYQRNLGQGRFAPGEAVARKPSFAGIGAGLQVVDLAGDGRKQLVSLRDEPRGYFELDRDEQRFRSFQGLPNVDLKGTHVHLIDLNGDGRPELLVAEESVFTWYEFTGSHGFVAARTVPRSFDEEAGPQLVFADAVQTIFLADMSGDGLTDIVRVRNGQVCYWPNLGYGRFGAKVSMDGSPLFDHPEAFNPARLRLADIDGSGTADIVYLGRDQFRCWKNLSGNRFGARPFVIDAPPEMHNQAQVSVMDLLGDGVACIVWSSSQAQDAGGPLKYIDLMRGRKPHLLTGYRNHLGKEVRLDYTPSTRFYLDDRAAGRPWVGGLHFPVHCVSTIETSDRLSGHRFVTAYRYHHGHFDPEDREFRGFGMVEQTDTEAFEHWAQGEGSHIVDRTLHQPPAVTKQWFHTGACSGADPFTHDHWPAEMARQGFATADPEIPRDALRLVVAPGLDPALADRLGSADWRDAARACKGRRLRTEVFAHDAPLVGATPELRRRQGVPYSVEATPCVVELLQPRGPNRHAVFVATEGETISYLYEREPDDPRITHQLNLAFDEHANVQLSAEVAYPRRRPDPGLPAATQQAQARAAVVVTCRRHTDDACGLHSHRLRLPSEEQVFELPGLAVPSNGCSIESLRTAWADPTQPRRLLTHRRHRFHDDTLARALPLHRLHPLALPCETLELAFTAPLLDEVFGGRVDDTTVREGGYVRDEGDATWWVRSASHRYLRDGEDAAAAHGRFCRPVAHADAHGALSQLQYGEHCLYVASVEDAAGNRTSVQRFDWRTLSPTRLMDANDNCSEVRMDELGRVKALAVFGKGDEGDDLAGLTDATDAEEAAHQAAFFSATDGTTLTDAARALLGHATARFVHDEAAYRRCGAPAALASIVRERHHREGEGSPLQISIEYSNGLGRVLMKKAQAAPGRARRVVLRPDDRYAVAEVDTAALQPPQLRWIGSGRSVLDNKGSTVKQYEPYFSTTHRYEDLKELVETGVTPLMRHDALGRCVRTDLPEGGFSRREFGAWQEFHHDAHDTDPRSPHAGTPERRCFDPQGRTVLGIVHHRSGGVDELHTTVFDLDVQGRLCGLTNANGHAVLRYRHDLRGHELRQDSADAGSRWMLPDVLGQALRAWDERGHEIRYRHDDPLHRLTQVRVRGGDGPQPLDHVVERRCYGEAEADASAHNLRGRLVRQYDGAGLLQTLACDRDGHPTATVRRLARDHRGVVDWSEARLHDGPYGALDDAVFTFRMQTDALGRIARRTLPDGRVVTLAYDAGGLLQAQAVDGTVHVADIAYNAKGQRERLVYGNGVVTRFDYDPCSFRLVRLHTRRRDGSLLQDWRYTHDAVGNITRIEDRCALTTIFGNQEVEAVRTYAYDALYRLTEAGGREHAAALHLGGLDAWSDTPWQHGPTPGDPLALRRYRQQYTYDRAGNLLRLQHQAPGGDWCRHYSHEPGTHRLVQSRIGGQVETYPHQRHGAMTALPHLQRLDWSFDERLMCSVRQRRNDGGTPETTWYQYDADGRRVRKVTERAAAPGQAATVKEERICLDGYELYRHHAGKAAGLVRTSLSLMDGDHRFATLDTRNEVDDGSEQQLARYLLHDHQGSACLELDGSPEARVISHEEYHPYGTTAFRLRSREVRAAARRYRFTGMERDEESGLQCHGARYYAPWLGRWISSDPRLREGVSAAGPPTGRNDGTTGRQPPGPPAHEPARTRQSAGQDGDADPRDLNPYAYASLNPLLYRDPSGEVPILQAWYDGAKNASSAGKLGYGFLFIFAWLAHVIVNLVVLALSVTLFNLGGLFGALDFSWSAPQSVLGLLAGTVLTLLGADVSPRWGMGAKVEMPAYMGNPGGMSLGPTVLAGHGFSEYSHEFGHTWQSRLLGPFYLLVIGIPSLISAATDPNNHRSFFSEKWADAWGT